MGPNKLSLNFLMAYMLTSGPVLYVYVCVRKDLLSFVSEDSYKKMTK